MVYWPPLHLSASSQLQRGVIKPGPWEQPLLNLQKTLPVVTSILIILVVAVLRERSRTLAAILSTMPINMVLALWIVLGAAPQSTQATLSFTRSLLVGLVPSFAWLVTVYFALRAEWNLAGAILAGYAIWGAMTATAFWMGIFALNR